MRTISGACSKAEAHGCPAGLPSAGVLGGFHRDGAHVQEGMPEVYVPCKQSMTGLMSCVMLSQAGLPGVMTPLHLKLKWTFQPCCHVSDGHEIPAIWRTSHCELADGALSGTPDWHRHSTCSQHSLWACHMTRCSLPEMADALLSCHSSMAFSDWRLAMISLLLKPWSSASHAGPRPMHISLRPLHVLCSFSHGSPGASMLTWLTCSHAHMAPLVHACSHGSHGACLHGSHAHMLTWLPWCMHAQAIQSCITRIPVCRSVALQKTFCGSPPACPVSSHIKAANPRWMASLSTESVAETF